MASNPIYVSNFLSIMSKTSAHCIYRIYLIIVLSHFTNYTLAQTRDINLLKKIYINHPTKLDGTFRLITKTSPSIWLTTPFSLIVVGIDNRNESITKGGFIMLISLVTAVTLHYELKLIQKQFDGKLM